MTRRAVLGGLWAWLLGLLGCSPTALRVKRSQSADRLQFMYFGSLPGQLEATRDHVTHHWISPWSGEQLALIAATELPIVLEPASMEPDALFAEFLALHERGLLGRVRVIYVQDEPNLAAQRVDPLRVRAAMAPFAELASTKLGVIYSSGNEERPGIEHFDFVGVDNYGAGTRALEDIDKLVALLAPDQRVWLVPGGADPWRQDPAPFLAAALADDRIAGLVCFAWFDGSAENGFGTGIGRNGLGERYRAVGRQIRGV